MTKHGSVLERFLLVSIFKMRIKNLNNVRPFWASMITQLVKNLPVMQDTAVLLLGGEDPLEKG